MSTVIWLGVYVSPFLLILLGVYTGYALWCFIHRVDEGKRKRVSL